MLRAVATSLKKFSQLESASGLCLTAATIIACTIANSSLSSGYAQILAAPVGPYSISLWINDGLMAIFFFIVGMEIKHELTDGSLASVDRALLPMVAAVGGMAVPATVFYLFAGSTSSAHGWGIPMATDIAFALGFLSLLGRRVPAQLKVFLLALAIVDDIGAVLVIAIFYSSGIAFEYLLAAFSIFALIWFLSRKKICAIWIHLPLGLLAWWLIHHSGVHATIAGCILGFLMPREFLEKWIARLHPVSGFFIMPIFALANAGISFAGVSLAALFTNKVVGGISYGLFLGKPIGIFGASFIAVRLGIAKLPDRVGFLQILGVSALAGVGFTMALFISDLALKSPEAIELAKLGIMKGSLLSVCAGLAILTLASAKPVSTKVEST